MRVLTRLMTWAKRTPAAYADARVAALRREVGRSQRELEAHKKRLAKAEARMEKELAAGKAATDRAYGLNRQLQAALDAAEQALFTANEVVIPGLINANMTFKEAYTAESAQQVMRQVALDKGPS